MASKLDNILSTLSRGTLATAAIGIGILLIIFSDPPQSLCQAQVNYLKEQQKGFLFAAGPKERSSHGGNFQQMAAYCLKGDGPGACYEVFAKMRVLVRDLKSVPEECASSIGDMPEVKQALWGTVRYMTTAAWGKVPPASYVDKLAWLDQADVALFCGLRTQITRFYGDSSWDQFRESLFTELPGAKSLQRKDAWQKMLLSEDCRRY